MQVARILALVFFVAVALGDLSFSGTTQAGGNTAISLTSSSALDSVLAAALGGSIGGTGINVTTSSATTSFTVSVSLTANAFASVNIAGGAGNAATTSLLAALGATSAISVSISATPATSVTLTLQTSAASFSGSASVQLGLLAGFNDASTSGLVYGAVAYNVNTQAKTITYTIPVGFAPQLFLVALDTSLSASAASSASGGQSSDSSNPGSSNFKYNGKFIPVSYNSDFALTVGQQYSYGSNILVTPIGTSGQSAGTLNINYVGSLAGNGSTSSSASAAPNSAAYFKGYYQISGSAGTNNVLQWTSDTSNSGAVFVKGGAAITAQAFATQYANTATWVKANANAGAQASASAWGAVSSSRQVSASGKLSVYANVNSYSQWTVAASGDATSIKAGLLIVVVAVLAALF